MPLTTAAATRPAHFSLLIMAAVLAGAAAVRGLASAARTVRASRGLFSAQAAPRRHQRQQRRCAMASSSVQEPTIIECVVSDHRCAGECRSEWLGSPTSAATLVRQHVGQLPAGLGSCHAGTCRGRWIPHPKPLWRPLLNPILLQECDGHDGALPDGESGGSWWRWHGKHAGRGPTTRAPHNRRALQAAKEGDEELANALATAMTVDVLLHSRAEEAVLYPFLMKRLGEEGKHFTEASAAVLHSLHAAHAGPGAPLPAPCMCKLRLAAWRSQPLPQLAQLSAALERGAR